MSIQIIKSEKLLHARFLGELGKVFLCDLTPLLTIGVDLERFIKPILDDIGLKRPTTIKGELQKLKALGEA